MLVSGYTVKSQVKQNNLCLPRSEVMYDHIEAGLTFTAASVVAYRKHVQLMLIMLTFFLPLNHALII